MVTLEIERIARGDTTVKQALSNHESELDLIVKVAERMARRANCSFIADEAKIRAFEKARSRTLDAQVSAHSENGIALTA